MLLHIVVELAGERAGAVARGADRPGDRSARFRRRPAGHRRDRHCQGAVVAGPEILAWPITFLTLGLFLLVINAILFKLASLFTPGFRVRGFLSAIWARWC